MTSSLSMRPVRSLSRGQRGLGRERERRETWAHFTVWLKLAKPFERFFWASLRLMLVVAPWTVEAAWPATDWSDEAMFLCVGEGGEGGGGQWVMSGGGGQRWVEAQSG